MYVKIITPVGKMDIHLSLENTRKLLKFAFSHALPEKELLDENVDVTAPVDETMKRTEEERIVPEPNPVIPKVQGEPIDPEPISEDVPPKILPKKIGYKGFLLLKCRECGEIKGFCAKEPISEFRCQCGAVTPLDENLLPAFLRCQCGSTWHYRTNVKDDIIEYNCLNCGCPVDMSYNKKKGRYDTIRD